MRGAELIIFGDIKSFFTNYCIYNKNIWEHVPPPDEEEPHDKNENKKKEGEEAPLNLDYNIKELESDQQEADKSGKSFLIEEGAVMADRHRTIRSEALKLLGVRIMRVMAIYKCTSP